MLLCDLYSSFLSTLTNKILDRDAHTHTHQHTRIHTHTHHVFWCQTVLAYMSFLVFLCSSKCNQWLDIFAAVRWVFFQLQPLWLWRRCCHPSSAQEAEDSAELQPLILRCSLHSSSDLQWWKSRYAVTHTSSQTHTLEPSLGYIKTLNKRN